MGRVIRAIAFFAGADGIPGRVLLEMGIGRSGGLLQRGPAAGSRPSS